MISAHQIRAARAFLDWSTADLAKRTGLTINGINKIERGHVSAQRDTLDKIQSVLEENGIEFLPGSGLRQKDRMVTTIRGLTSNTTLAIDVSNTLDNTGGELLILADEDASSKHLDRGILEAQFEKRKKANISHRFLIPPQKEVLNPAIEHDYRRIAAPYIPSCPLFIYGPKIAFLIPEFTPKVVIVEAPQLSDAARKLFSFAWDHANIHIPEICSPLISSFRQPVINPLAVKITGEHIRAARAFLDWSTADLAAQSGIAVNSINKIERGQTKPQEETIAAIQKTFEDSGVEFLPSSGIKRNEQVPTVWTDNNACHRLFDDISMEMRDSNGGEVLFSGLTEQNRMAVIGEKKLSEYHDTMEQYHATERILLKAGDINCFSAVRSYRWLPEKYFSPHTICIYGSKIALVLWQTQRVVIINDIRMTQSMRCLFDYVWDHLPQDP